MALKDLLVYLDPTEGSLGRLRLAADLARRHQSCLTALYVRQWTPGQLERRKTAELAGRPLSELGDIQQAAEESIDRSAVELRSAFQRLTAQNGLEAEWRMLDGQPGSILPQHALYSDLCILGAQMPEASTPAGYRFSDEMLFAAGRPVLLVPRAAESTALGSHVAIAWNSSRSAARALNDALPLLERSERATVIVVNPTEFVRAHAALAPAQLLQHLRRHGISADWVELCDVPASAIASTLQEKAHAAGADMIVAGAHGHTWMHEVLLGSVTRDVLSDLRIAVMMSH